MTMQDLSSLFGSYGQQAPAFLQRGPSNMGGAFGGGVDDSGPAPGARPAYQRLRPQDMGGPTAGIKQSESSFNPSAQGGQPPMQMDNVSKGAPQQQQPQQMQQRQQMPWQQQPQQMPWQQMMQQRQQMPWQQMMQQRQQMPWQMQQQMQQQMPQQRFGGYGGMGGGIAALGNAQGFSGFNPMQYGYMY